jgi:hypothetical protein
MSTGTPRFGIGTTFNTRGKGARFCTVVDIYYTYNSRGELVKYQYVATHDMMGQLVYHYDVVDTTIATGLVEAQPYTQETC